MPIDVLAGPGCAEIKLDEIDELAAGRESFVVIDVTRVYRALGGEAVSPASDPVTFSLAQYLTGTALRQATRQRMDGVVTTSTGSRARIQALAEISGGRVLVVDRGRAETCRRLRRAVPQADRRDVCEDGLSRWYDQYQPEPGDIQL